MNSDDLLSDRYIPSAQTPFWSVNLKKFVLQPCLTNLFYFKLVLWCFRYIKKQPVVEGIEKTKTKNKKILRWPILGNFAFLFKQEK